MKKRIIIIAIVAVLLAAAVITFFLLKDKSDSPNANGQPNTSQNHGENNQNNDSTPTPDNNADSEPVATEATVWLITKITRYDSSGTLSYIQEYAYSDAGIMEESLFKSYSSSGAEESSSEYIYDEHGYYTEYTYRESSGYDNSGTAENEYDSAGNLVQRTTYDKHGLVDRRYVYTYDNQNNLIKEEHYIGNRVSTSYTYTYDSNNNLIRKSDGEEFDRGWAYDANNRLLARIAYANGEEVDRYSYTYNQNGQLISSKYDSDSSSTTYAYNEDGGLKKITSVFGGYYEIECVAITADLSQAQKLQKIQHDLLADNDIR